MHEMLIKMYQRVLNEYGFEKPLDAKQITCAIKKMLNEFLSDSKTPAIYGYGGHTKMLMSDFMFELKKVRIIVEEYGKQETKNGFFIIRDDDIETKGVDAIIISSYKFRDEIAERIRRKHPGVKYLDIYKEFEKLGIHLMADYYYNNHPHHHYKAINELQRILDTETVLAVRLHNYMKLIGKYLQIKDFKNALIYAKELFFETKDELYRSLCHDIAQLYQLELDACKQIGKDNVLFFCMDGLRYRDVCIEKMPALTQIVEERGYSFDECYSFSTSTFESLVPVYSENTDLRTKYYQHNYVEKGQSRFVREAKHQNRKICFYSDMDHYIEDDSIQYAECFATVTEKLWSFILDAVEEDNGLFYIHELYETHYSFANPYTKEKLLAEGTAMLFDYLPQKGGSLRADYVTQHDDAIRYVDDVVSPFLQNMQCNILLYADHGNLILPRECKAEEVPAAKLLCDDEWTRIPLIMFSNYTKPGHEKSLSSLLMLNDIIVSMLQKKEYVFRPVEHIKIARSELYNPDFRYLYEQWNQQQKLLAFECFVFHGGMKLVVYSNGVLELYQNDSIVIDRVLLKRLLNRISLEITVCDLTKIDCGV